jgi:para-nitrobenzyl esterase
MQTLRAETPYASLIGRKLEKGAAFLGVPYAAPPTGAGRFRPPEPIAHVDGEVEALRAGPAPCQIVRPTALSAGPGPTGEDCLTLNVWTPGADDARRPVLVHLFGGGFEGGAAFGGLQDAESLAARGDVVVVRVGFRVGVLGFLHLGAVWGEPYAAGNVGLLDAIAALEWVRRNIAGLGGDPDNVTVFGVSSGAFMIAGLFAAPAARGLFRRAWMQSGSASRIVGLDAAAELASRFLGELGVRTSDQAALEALTVEQILAAQEAITMRDLGARNAPGAPILGIVVDGQTVTEHPLAVFARGDARDRPIVLGATRDEARLWFALGLMQAPESEGALVAEMARFAGAERAPGLLAAYRAMYPAADLERLRERFLTDAVYRVPAWRTALAQAAAGGAAWRYEFGWAPVAGDGKFGAAHGFDEPFVWGVTDPAAAPLLAGAGPDAASLAAELSGALLAFARTGSPGWPAVAPDAAVCRDFPGGLRGQADAAPLLAAWEGINRG